MGEKASSCYKAADRPYLDFLCAGKRFFVDMPSTKNRFPARKKVKQNIQSAKNRFPARKKQIEKCHPQRTVSRHEKNKSRYAIHRKPFPVSKHNNKTTTQPIPEKPVRSWNPGTSDSVGMIHVGEGNEERGSLAIVDMKTQQGGIQTQGGARLLHTHQNGRRHDHGISSFQTSLPYRTYRRA